MLKRIYSDERSIRDLRNLFNEQVEKSVSLIFDEWVNLRGFDPIEVELMILESTTKSVTIKVLNEYRQKQKSSRSDDNIDVLNYPNMGENPRYI
jgi:hypothetical protein